MQHLINEGTVLQCLCHARLMARLVPNIMGIMFVEVSLGIMHEADDLIVGELMGTPPRNLLNAQLLNAML